MNPPIFRLTVRTGPVPGAIYKISEPEISIGREPSNQIALNDLEVSRRHARLIQQAGSYVFQDLGSTNGSFVNGKRLMGPHLLRSGEAITLGQNVNLIYEIVQPDIDATVVSTPDAQPGYSATMVESPAPTYSPPKQVQPTPRQTVTPPPPIYAINTPQEPVEAYPSVQEEPRKGIDTRWLLAGCGCLAIVACLGLTAFLLWIDAGGTERWCQFFGFIFPACP